MGDSEIAKVVTSAFLNDLPRLTETIKTGIDHDDFVNVLRTAHQLKGAAGVVGGEAVRSLAMEIELAAKKSDKAWLAKLKLKIDPKTKALEHALKEVTDSKPTVTEAATLSS